MRGWLLTATVSILAAGVAVGLLASQRRPRPPKAAAPAPACPPDEAPPPPPPATAGLELAAPPGAGARLDGAPLPAASRPTAGRHLLEAAGGLRLTLELRPFSPARVELVPDGEHLLPVLLGAGCASCEPPPAGDVELGPLPPPAPLGESARALGTGGWRVALEALRRVQGTVRVRQQQASAWSLVGRPSRVPSLRAAQARLEARRTEEARREQAWQLLRWNLATERLTRLLTAFSLDAERLVSAAGVRTEQLSAAFGAAAERQDLPAGQATLEAAEATLEALRADLLALRPSDCAWRRRVAQSLAGP